MLAVLLTIHMIACVALVIAVMLQRSEGGALGMGGGGTGGIISGRGAAGVLVKTTMVLAGVFFVTSITMTRLNNDQLNAPTALERQANETPVDPFAPTSGTTPSTTTPAPSTTAPSTTTPAAPAPAPAVDPLAPRANTPAPATNNTAPATTPPATTPAPATTTPTAPAPTP
jgi:preprotein translocase subunit SecG